MKILNQLKEYFNNTPRDVVEKEWHEYDKYNKIGPTVNEYFNELKIMKPFNIEEAKLGAKVCTRDGRAVRIICFDRKTENNYFPIVALIAIDDAENEAIQQYDSNGFYNTDHISPRDLMMAPKEKYAWVILYREHSTGAIKSDTYPTKETAELASMHLKEKENIDVLIVKELKWEE